MADDEGPDQVVGAVGLPGPLQSPDRGGESRSGDRLGGGGIDFGRRGRRHGGGNAVAPLGEAAALLVAGEVGFDLTSPRQGANLGLGLLRGPLGRHLLGPAPVQRRLRGCDVG
ncbi:MAG: hypothetical protein WKF43_01880 [Acidimicrobiales bacterium]